MRNLLPLTIATSLSLAGCVLPVGQAPQPGASGAPIAAPPMLTPIVTTSGGIATSLKAKQATLDLTLGAEQPLNTLVLDQAGLVPTAGVIWLSSNDKVATVNPTSGQVRAIGTGTAVITAVLQANPTAKAQIEVRVGEQDLVKTIVIEPGTTKLEAGGRVTLTATVNMADGTINGNVKWASSDDTVATVNPTTGEVTALKDGKVTIEGLFAPDPRFKGVAIITVGDLPATPPAPPPGSVLPGGEPGEIVNVAPKGRWIAQVIDGVTSVKDVWFRNGTDGWLNTAEGLFATNDAGTTWKVLNAAPGVNLGGGVAWFDADTAISVSYNDILRTVDGGAIWEQQPQTLPAQPKYTTPGFLRPQVVGPSEAYALVTDLMPFAYFSSLVYHTTDQGATWTQENWAAFKQVRIAAVVAVGGAEIAMTAKGLYRREAGEDWALSAAAATGTYAAGGVTTGSLAVVPGTSTVFAGSADLLLRSDDAGKTWANLGNPAAKLSGSPNPWAGPHTLSFSDVQHGLAINAYNALTTGDGGKTWVKADTLEKSLAVRDGARLRSGARLSADRAFVVGHDGTLHRFVLP